MDIAPTGISSTSAAAVYVHALRPVTNTVTVVTGVADPFTATRDIGMVGSSLASPFSESRRVDIILTWDDVVGGITILDGGSPGMGAANYADGGGPTTNAEDYVVIYEGDWA